MNEYMVLDKDKRIVKRGIKTIMGKIKNTEDKNVFRAAIDFCEGGAHLSYIETDVFEAEREEKIFMPHVAEVPGFDVILTVEDEGGFCIECPELPGCISQGETEEEAIKNIREAMEGYLTCMRKTEVFDVVSQQKTKIMRI